MWKYLLWDKKLSFCISSFVFSFELELQINLGWKGLLEVIWSIGSLRFYRFYRLSEYCEWLLSNLSSLGWKVWRSFNAFHLSYSIFSSFWWTLHWSLSRFSVSVLKWRTKSGCIIQGTSAQVLNRVQWSHALTCCRLGHALSSLPQGCSADSHVACHLPAPPSTLQQSWFLDSYNCDLYSWSLYQLSSATKGISRLSAWVILGHDYCSGKRWEQIRCRCLQRDDRMCTHTYTPHLSALIVPKWNWCFNFFKPSGAICFFHLKDNVRAQTVLMLRKKIGLPGLKYSLLEVLLTPTGLSLNPASNPETGNLPPNLSLPCRLMGSPPAPQCGLHARPYLFQSVGADLLYPCRASLSKARRERAVRGCTAQPPYPPPVELAHSWLLLPVVLIPSFWVLDGRQFLFCSVNNYAADEYCQSFDQLPIWHWNLFAQ